MLSVECQVTSEVELAPTMADVAHLPGWSWVGNVLTSVLHMSVHVWDLCCTCVYMFVDVWDFVLVIATLLPLRCCCHKDTCLTLLQHYYHTTNTILTHFYKTTTTLLPHYCHTDAN